MLPTTKVVGFLWMSFRILALIRWLKPSGFRKNSKISKKISKDNKFNKKSDQNQSKPIKNNQQHPQHLSEDIPEPQLHDIELDFLPEVFLDADFFARFFTTFFAMLTTSYVIFTIIFIKAAK